MPLPCVLELPSAPFLVWIAPPVQVAEPVHEPPFPVTVKAPAPVVSSVIPLFVPPVDEMLRKVNPVPPIVVFCTISGEPDVVVSVLTIVVLFWVTLTVPPLVAVKAALAPVERTRPPEKLMVPLSLLSRLTPVPPVLVTAPVNWTRPGVPVLRLVTSTARPAALVMVPA